MTFKNIIPVLAFFFLSCANSDPGAQLKILANLQRNAENIQQSGSYQFTSALGYTITLEKLYLVISEIEISKCVSAKPRLGLIPVAYAHTASSATSSGIPVILDILDFTSTNSPLASLEPPIDSYCRLSFTLGPADDDAEAPSSEILEQMQGLAVYASGTYRAQGTNTDIAFELSSPISLNASIPFAQSGESEIYLMEPSTVLLNLKVEQWFQTADFANQTSTQIAGEILLEISEITDLSIE